MGKHNFAAIYKQADSHLGGPPSIKLSTFCDEYHRGKNFAGIIIYHAYGSYTWKQRPGQGVAGGYRGRGFYVLILCTDSWPAEVWQAAGQGVVHDYLYRQYFAMDYSTKKSCCAGFAILKGQTAYSSVYLNQQDGCVGDLAWWSDGSKYVSKEEKSIINIAICRWKQSGGGIVVDIDESLHRKLMRY